MGAGCNADNFTVPASSTLVTSTSTASLPTWPVPSVASTVISYRLSVSISAGFSKLGDFTNANTPPAIVKSAASSPLRLHFTATPSGSTAVYVATAPVPFSGYSFSASPVTSGSSSASVTVMVTSMEEESLNESVAVSVTM